MEPCNSCEQHKQNYINTREQRDFLCERLGVWQEALRDLVTAVQHDHHYWEMGAFQNAEKLIIGMNGGEV